MKSLSRCLMVYVAILLVAGAAPSAEAGRGVPWFKGTLDEAMKAAEGQGRLVLVDCWATWCKYCHVMDQDVWSQPGLARILAEQTVPIKREVDASRGLGLDISGRYGVEGLPVVLFLDPHDGRLLHKLTGFCSADRILQGLREAWKAAHAGAAPPAARGMDPAEALSRARQMLSKRDSRGALRAAKTAWRGDVDCSRAVAGDAALMIASIEERAGHPDRGLEMLRQASARCADQDGGALWQRRIELAAETGGEAARGKELEAWTRARPEDPAAWLAWGIWWRERGDDPARSVEILERAAQLAPDDPLPLAELARARAKAGDLDRALEAVDQAIRIDPHDPDLRELRLDLTRRRRSLN